MGVLVGLACTTWLASGSVAAAAEPDSGLRLMTGTGLVVGTVGAATSGFGLALLASPEPVGFAVLYPPGSIALASGTALTLGGSYAQARRVGASPTASVAGLALLGAGGAVALTGIAVNEGRSPTIGVIGGTTLGTLGLILGGVQGASNLSVASGAARRERVRLWAAPLGDRPGLRVGGVW